MGCFNVSIVTEPPEPCVPLAPASLPRPPAPARAVVSPPDAWGATPPAPAEAVVPLPPDVATCEDAATPVGSAPPEQAERHNSNAGMRDENRMVRAA